MNQTRTIIARIEKINSKKDKNGKDYLILEVDSDSVIFVFPNLISSESWNLLKENKEYNFTLEESKNSNNLLVSFSPNEQPKHLPNQVLI